MEYIGEHLFAGQLGRFLASLAFASAIVAAIAYFIFLKNSESSYKKVARAAFGIHAGSVFGIIGTLFYMMLNFHFEYSYVWEHTSRDLPLRYMFSAFWEGQEGSFLLWMFWHSVLGLVLMFTAKRWESGVMGVFAVVQAFLASMILGVFPFGWKIGSSPFILMRELPENIGLPWTQVADYLERFPAFFDGSGLNPLLQNYWMTIHPPVLFLGFASVLVPFAFAMGGLLKKDFTGWVKPALPWTFFSVGILGTGILMGGAWAYEALSFGGFWAWDPVENSSLVPWIILVGAAHLLLIVKNRRTGLTSAFFLTLLAFLAVLYSTFLTRSGVLGDTSVHAFVDLGLNGQLLTCLLFFVIVSFGIYFFRYKNIPKNKKEDQLSSREFWMFIGSLVLLISAFQIIFSTSIPVINKLIGPDGFVSILDEKMAPPTEVIDHYNSFQIPFAIVIALLVAFGQYLNYQKTDLKRFWKNILISIIIAILLTISTAFSYNFWKQPLYLVLLFAGIFAAVSNLYYWLSIKKGKIGMAGSSIAHVGFALILVGALISQGKQDIISETDVFLSEDLPASENALLELRTPSKLGKYTAIFNGKRDTGDQQFYSVSYYNSETEKKAFDLEPHLLFADNMGPTPNPDTRHFWHKDIYTHVQYSSYLEPKSDDGYIGEMEAEVSRGDSIVFQRHFVVMDSLKVNAKMDSTSGELAALKLTARLKIVNVLGQEFLAEPAYILNGNEVSHQDAIMEEQGFKFRLADINTETNQIQLKAWTKANPDEKPFIVMKAIVFPLINLLWAGCILMAIGTGVAVWERVRKS